MTHTDIAQICLNAQQALDIYKNIDRKTRYDFLHNIAHNLLAIQHDIIHTAHRETHISLNDLTSELDRTIFQIQNYSQTLLLHTNFGVSHNLSLEYEPIGCVAVFGASNFPLAYSTIGGDVVCALIAGSSVIFKAHEAHSQTSALVAKVIKHTIAQMNMPEYVYQHIADISHEQASVLVQNPHIKAVGFTGSLAVGRYLFDLCQQRPNPIPFFGELGSINPVFITQDIFEKTYDAIAYDYVQAFTKRGGQLCVNPAVLIIPKSPLIAEFYTLLNRYLQNTVPQMMLTDNILEKFKQAYQYRKENYPILTNFPVDSDTVHIPPVLFTVSVDEWLSDLILAHEVFGMMGIIIDYESHDDLYKIADSFSGQLTASLHGTVADKSTIQTLVKILSPKVGRLVFNDYPTSVKLDDNMHHGGVYPASTCSQFTAVGTRAIQRFLRPVCYQNKPNFLNHYFNKHNFFLAKTPLEQTEKLVNYLGQKLNDTVLHKGTASLGVFAHPNLEPFLKLLSLKNLRWDCINIDILNHTDNLVITDTPHTLKIICINSSDTINNNTQYDCCVIDEHINQIPNNIYIADNLCLVMRDNKTIHDINTDLLEKIQLNIFSIEE